MGKVRSNTRFTSLLIFSFIFISLCTAQDKGAQQANKTAVPNENVLLLGTSKTIKLKPNEAYKLTLTILNVPKQKQSLYIEAQSPFNDPYEQPRITINSDKNFIMICDEDVSDYVGICQIENEELTKNRKFEISLVCEVDCELTVSAYLNELYSSQIGQDISLMNSDSTPMVQNIEILIGKDSSFTDIMIVGTKSENDASNESVVIVANYGAKPTIPTIAKYSKKAQSTSLHRLGIFLSSKQISAGQKIVLSILLPPKTSISLSSRFVNGNKHQIQLNSPVYDFTAENEQRIYVLDLQDFEDQSDFDYQNLFIKFISYSGSPQVGVSFDQNFTSVLNTFNHKASFIFELTPEQQNEEVYKGLVFIKVSSFWSSNYYLEVFADQKDFVDLQTELPELVRVEPDKIKNLIYVDETYHSDLPKDGVVEYQLTLAVQQNVAEFYVRNCKEENIIDCIVYTNEDLKETKTWKQFNDIKLKSTKLFDEYIIKFNLNVSKDCELISGSSSEAHHVCTFQILIKNPDSQPNTTILTMVEVKKNVLHSMLKQGQLSRGTVKQAQQNFYAFQLTSTEGIKSLQFVLNVIQGEASILMSQSINYPRVSDMGGENDLQWSIYSTLEVSGSDLKVGTYYLSVHGYASTDYTFGIAVSRIKKGTNATQAIEDVTGIHLSKGVSLTYSISEESQNSAFVFTPTREGEKSIIIVNQIENEVTFVIYDKMKPQVPIYSSLNREDDEVQITTIFGHIYTVNVTGQKGKKKTFTILYTEQTICDSYQWNFPINAALYPGDSLCYNFELMSLEDMHVSVGLSALQQFNEDIEVGLNFRNQKKMMDVTGSDKIITKKQLQLVCGKSKLDCSFAVQIRNKKKSTENDDGYVNFDFAVQTYNGNNILFNGISSIITTDKLSVKKSQKFYFYPSTFIENDIVITLQSSTLSQYQINAVMVESSEFLSVDDDQLFGQFNTAGNNMISVNSSRSSSITLLRIPKQRIQKFQQSILVDEDVVLLISVYGMNKANSVQMSVFQIEVNEAESTLAFGDSVTGFIKKDGVFTYNIDAKSNSVVEIRSLDNSEETCTLSYVYTSIDNKTQQFVSSVNFINITGTRMIVVTTKQQSCTYQISYRSLDVPLVVALPNIHYKIEADSVETRYFLYHHVSKQSFYVLQMVNNGGAYLTLTRIKDDESIDKVIESLQLRNGDEELISDYNGDLEVLNKSSNFCTNCYYLISVLVNEYLDAEIVVNLKSVPIPLKDSIKLRDRLEKETNFYELYSSVNFSLKINVIFGEVELIIRDPRNVQVFGEKVSSQQSQLKANIDAPQGVSGQSDYLNIFALFKVEVKSLGTASYYISMQKKAQGNQLSEGLPVKVSITEDQTKILGFESARTSGNLTILVEDLKHSENGYNNQIKFVIRAAGQTNNLIQTLQQSEGSYSLSIPRVEGKYELVLIASRKTQLSIIILKNEYNHLSPGRSYILNNLTNFEVFSPGDSIIVELYTCRGNLQLQAARNYSTLNKQTDDETGLVRMQHGNYGGHYVVTAENIKGEYFLKVGQNSDQQVVTDVKYIISYYLFNPEKGETNPYKLYQISSQKIRYRYNADTIEFLLNRVTRKDGVEMKGEVTYNFYVSTDKSAVEEATRCSIAQQSMKNVSRKVSASQHGSISFVFEISEIKKLIGDQDSYIVGAQATLKFGNQPLRINEANFIYETTQLVFSNSNIVVPQTKIEQLRTFALWIAVPFLVGSVILFFSVRFLVRSYRRAYPTQLIEEDPEHVGSEVPVAGASQTF